MNNLKIHKDSSREGFTILKLIQLFKLFLPKNTKALAKLNKFTDLNIAKINKLRNLKIKGLIIDVDDCIAYNHGKILKQNIEYIKKLNQQGLKMIIYSNAKYSKRLDDIAKYVDILTNLPAKPDKKGFQKACNILNLKPSEVAMVGDNYITDSGCIQLRIHFIRIKPIKSKIKPFYRAILMWFYNCARNFYDKISWFHDLWRTKPLTSKDLKD